MGVMNGTCNYILTEMEAREAPYEEMLDDAQRLGYAEADPTFDVGGIDAAHKLALLASVAFGTRVDFAGVQTEGIEPRHPHRHLACEGHGVPDQAAGRRSDDRAGAGAADDALPRAR